MFALDMDELTGRVRIEGYLLVPASANCPDDIAVRRELLESAETVLRALARRDIVHVSHPQIKIDGTVMHRVDGSQNFIAEGSMTLDLQVLRRFET